MPIGSPSEPAFHTAPATARTTAAAITVVGPVGADGHGPLPHLSQQRNEAGGSLDRETPARVVSSPDNDGTGRHYRMAWVRQA